MTSPYTGKMACPRCARLVAEEFGVGGCRSCAADGVPVNLHTNFLDYDPVASADPNEPGIFRWRAGYPIAPTSRPVSLGEGNTPAFRSEALAKHLGVRSVILKDESQNPTSSYKDRLAAVAITKAVEMGARTVVVASTGNHGAAAAAYAAAAGLECVVLAARSASVLMVEQMRVYGARVIALPTIPDRWTVMRAGIEEFGWFPVSGYSGPPIGSPPYGIEGYKSIAFELFEQLGGSPSKVIVPTAYGDGLTGIARGFEELRAVGHIDALPRMIAAEALGPHARGIRNDCGDVVPEIERRPTLAFSAGTPVGTYQTLATIRRTEGAAAGPVSDREILDAQALIARTTGIYAETTSAMSLAVAVQLRDSGALSGKDQIVLVITSSGLKSAAETSAQRADIPVIEPTITALRTVL